MSKAFTREDDDAGFVLPAALPRLSEARLTAYGARVVRERIAELEGAGDPATRLHELLDGATVVEPAAAEHVALGARVTFRSSRRSKGSRTVVIATPDEVGLVPLAVSAGSPLAQALLGAERGDVVELELAGAKTSASVEELTVTKIEWPA